MIPAPIVTPPAHPARGGGQAGRGCPEGGGQDRCYAFLGRPEAVTSDTVITCIVSVIHRDILVIFDHGSIYSYAPSYFPSCLDMPCDSLDIPVDVSTPFGDSIMVDRVYCSCVVTINVYDIMVDPLLLDMVDFEVILDTDWLSPYHAILDYHAKTMTLAK
ncbi:uncharacterized protein [Nicotiana tomentosiformis]|uniref:uncharacterized protein n=1 Tax=Nicotiana tomentosiformis TaxID=4098 RepID=UPI00388C5C4F